MSSDGVIFDRRSAARIAEHVRADDTAPIDLTPQSENPRQPRKQSGFWVELTDGYDPDTGYPWKRMKPEIAGPGLERIMPEITGDHLFDPNNNRTLAAGVRVFIVPNGYSDDDPPVPRWLIQTSGIGGVERVRVLGNASGGGKYSGAIVQIPVAAISQAGDLVDSDLGSNSISVLILNAAEVGQSTHDLTADTQIQKTFIAVYLGMSADDPSQPVYQINGFDWAECSQEE